VRCDLCGREGERRFQVTEPVVINDPKFGRIETARLVACTGREACRRRAYSAIPVDERGRRRGARRRWWADA